MNSLSNILARKSPEKSSDGFLHTTAKTGGDVYPFGMQMPGRIYNSDDYRYGAFGYEKDDEIKGTGNHYSLSDYGYDPRVARRWRPDPHAANYADISPYAYGLNNPIFYIDPDGKDVIPTSALKGNESLYSFFQLATENSVFQNVMKSFYEDHNHVWVHVDQLKRDGEPTGFRNTARTQSNNYSGNPVGKYGHHRIIINSDILNSSGNIGIDKTFLLRALVHEGDHARMYERRRQDPNYENYPGHKDFIDYRSDQGHHHNQMGAFNRGMLVDAMKEFDDQIRESGGTVPEYHTEDWYQAMSW